VENKNKRLALSRDARYCVSTGLFSSAASCRSSVVRNFFPEQPSERRYNCATEAAGRVVNAETGQPLPRVSVLCMEADGRIRHGISATTDDEGRFTCANLAPGRYRNGKSGPA